MPRTVFTEHAVAEQCYLSEALLWVTVQRFPLAIGTENLDDAREHEDYLEGLDASHLYQEPLSREESARLGLPVDPTFEDLENGDFHETLESLQSKLRRTGEADGIRTYWETQLADGEEFYRRKAEWDDQYNSVVDLYKSKLFIALREGHVSASGKNLPKTTYEASVDHLEDSQWDGWWKVEWSPIPAEFWLSDKIDWRYSWAEGRNTAYGLILVNFEQLFSNFLPTAEVVEGLVKYGDAYVLLSDNENSTPRKTARGRPPMSWDSFHVEVARRFRGGDIPTKQEAFIAAMQEWCKTNWKKDVARSTLLQKLKPYYDAFVRGSENS